MTNARWLTLVLPWLAAATFAADRESTDVVTLLNGDRITCEIKSLRYGLLELSTSNAGTVKVEWPAVAGLSTQYEFFVEDVRGEVYYGVIRALSSGRFTVSNGSNILVDMPVLEVTRLSQIEEAFFERVTGAMSFGYNFTKSSDISVGNFNLNATYRAQGVESTLNISLNATDDSSGETTERNKISNITSFFAKRSRNYWSLLSAFERNEELGIDGRLQLGSGVGRHLSQGTTHDLSGLVGLAFTQEWTTETGAESQQSVEGVLGSEWRMFRFTDPELTLTTSLFAYPSVTESGRLRGDFNISLRREFFEDFTFDLSYYYAYDNEPPDPTASHNDYGVVTSLGYTF